MSKVDKALKEILNHVRTDYFCFSRFTVVMKIQLSLIASQNRLCALVLSILKNFTLLRGIDISGAYDKPAYSVTAKHPHSISKIKLVIGDQD